MKSRTPKEHETYNRNHYPDTRQICWLCEEPTERCKEDQILFKNKPICEKCFEILEKHNKLK